LDRINQIHVLSEALANQIAAGEVVERPASVVKELVENSLDAGSKKLTVIIKDGGQSLIQVVDNGRGMSREDALLAFQRHTTSKLLDFEDLHHIETFGFRGEALASIASVARMEIKTTYQDDIVGTFLKLEGGVLTDISDMTPVPGTSIAVKNLFYNTPARRKFLKSIEAEYRQILEIMKRFTLAFPEISFILINEGEIIYEFLPTSPEQRLMAVFGARCKNHLITVDDKTSLARVNGFIGDWELFRRARGQQYLFLNKRYIVNRSLNYAIVSGYGPTLPPGQFPLYTIFLDLPPQHFDVNVHPTKIEVKFAEERAIYAITHGAIQRALNTDLIIPHAQVGQIGSSELDQIERDRQEELGFTTSTQPFDGTKPPWAAPTTYKPEKDFIRKEWQSRSFQASSPASFSPRTVPTEAPLPTAPSGTPPLVWQLHHRYILTHLSGGLMVIDQHVAHERILFERAMADFEKKRPTSQQLLFPEVIELSPEDLSFFKEIYPFLEQIGYVIKEFSGRTITIEAVPAGVKHAGEEKGILGILDEFKKGRGETYDIRENVAKSFACKTAIKSGEKLSQQEMIALIDQLFETQTPYFCPHGRPVIINISLEELDKRFGRI